MVQIAPSLLSADFSNLSADIEKVTRGGAHALHVDVMDGHFVPNITIGPVVVQSVKNATQLPLDVHLMIENADRFIPQFIRAGADWITVHAENCNHLHRTITMIKTAGVKAGVALNPATPVGQISEILHKIDLVLIMSVNPGFGGQDFIPESLDKIRRISNVILSRGLKVLVSVDGGVTLENTPQLVRAGARILIAGSSVFGRANPEKAVRNLIEAAKPTHVINKKK